MIRKNTGIGVYVDIKDVKQSRALDLVLVATAAERMELAKRLKIAEVSDLKARITIMQGPRAELFTLTGQLQASIVQEFGISGTPISDMIEEEINEVLTTSEAALNAVHPEELDENAPVDLIENDRIDLKEIVSQWVGLSLDTFIQQGDSSTPIIMEEEGPRVQTPFKVLESLKSKK